MAILQLLAGVLLKKSDTSQNLAISSFIILIFNPYSLLDIGFQLSFGGTIGILVFSKKLSTKNKKTGIFQAIVNYIKEMCIISLSANLFILPIMLYHFHTFSVTFFLSNLLATPILAISLMLCMVFLLFIFISKPLAMFLSFLLQPMLQLLIQIAEFCSKLPLSQILVPTPKIWQIILYYFIILKKAFPYKRVILSLCIILLISPLILAGFPSHQLRIHFIDVGQGDSMFIQTPSKKVILVDGGGSETGNFNVGEKTLLPYLLNKGILKIDYIIVSHFDSDHCQGLFTIMQKLKVKNAIISKQGKESSNYKEFQKIVKQRNIKVITVKAGDRITIDSQCYIDILFPEDNLISENVLNNNSIVAKFHYRFSNNYDIADFSLLFTGDVEKIAENKLVELYEDTDKLTATILKVAHHGSKTSSTEEFLNLVNPKIALIGVGGKNTFGHPSDITLESLEELDCKIYRTDENGEIMIRVDRKGKIWINKMLN